MIQIIKENKWMFIIGVLIIGWLIFLASLYEFRQVGGVVYEHNVTANRHGNRTYSTLVKTDDGYVEEQKGLSLYVIPVGSRVTIEVKRLKNK